MKRRTKGSDDLNASMNRIAEALCAKEVPVINLPKVPEIDAMDGVFIFIKEKLLKLSPQKQNALVLQFLQDIIREGQAA